MGPWRKCKGQICTLGPNNVQISVGMRREKVSHLSTPPVRWKEEQMVSKDPHEASCISLPSPPRSSPVSEPWETEKLKNNISISLWFQRYKSIKVLPSAPTLHLSHACPQMRMGPSYCTTLGRGEGLKAALDQS